MSMPAESYSRCASHARTTVDFYVFIRDIVGASEKFPQNTCTCSFQYVDFIKGINNKTNKKHI